MLKLLWGAAFAHFLGRMNDYIIAGTSEKALFIYDTPFNL
jgi:hypothetical protein